VPGLEIIIKAILLGIIEGLTEFIPVSSTAHLLLASWIIDFSYVRNGVFEIAIQLGAILAICLLYWRKITDIVFSLHKKKSSRNFTFNIAIAFIPAALVGVLFHDFIKEILFSPKVIAWALIIGGIGIMIIEKTKIKPKYHNIENLPKSLSLLIGIFQSIAVIPGVSRSGATIIGSLVLKLDRKTATEFSFFLAIPTIFGATVYDIYKNYQFLDSSNFGIIFIGFIAAFFSSLVVIKWLINFVSNHNFMIFAYYRIIVGLILLITLAL
jgi:undecaprenyl-diphosphatase